MNKSRRIGEEEYSKTSYCEITTRSFVQQPRPPDILRPRRRRRSLLLLRGEPVGSEKEPKEPVPVAGAAAVGHDQGRSPIKFRLCI